MTAPDDNSVDDPTTPQQHDPAGIAPVAAAGVIRNAAPYPLPDPAEFAAPPPGGFDAYWRSHQSWEDVTPYLNDPIVTPPEQGFAGWWARIWRTFARSWKSLLLIVGLVSVVPPVMGVLVLFLVMRLPSMALLTGTQAQPHFHLRAFVWLIGMVLAFQLMAVYFSAIGWGAAFWTITRQAIGMPAPLGGALRFGLRRSGSVWGWQLLTLVISAAGGVCCYLPGLYLAAASSLIVPIAVFEGGNAMSASFRTFHRNFGPVLGRIALAMAANFAVGIILLVINFAANRGVTLPANPSVSNAPAMPSLSDSFGIGYLITAPLVAFVVGIPLQILGMIGILLTYAEMRARAVRLTTAHLVVEADARRG